jgi:hypothetical protein
LLFEAEKSSNASSLRRGFNFSTVFVRTVSLAFCPFGRNNARELQKVPPDSPRRAAAVARKTQHGVNKPYSTGTGFG